MKLSPIKNIKSRLFNRKTSKKGAVVVVVFTTILGILFNPFTRKIDAAWFNDNWAYRQRIAIANSSGSVQTDFQISFTIDTSALITAGKMQSDCDDIRVTDIGGNVLPHWLETASCNTSTTKIWTKVSSLPTAGSNVFFYYGNSQAVNAQNPREVFIFFDNFSNGLSNWITAGNCAATVTNGEMVISTSTQCDETPMYINNFNLSDTTGYVLEYRGKFASGGSNRIQTYQRVRSNGNNARFYVSGTNTYYQEYISGFGGGTDVGNSGMSSNIYYTIAAQVQGTNNTFYVNGTSIGSATTSDTSLKTQTALTAGIGQYQTTVTVDDVRIRKSASSLPTTSANSEEKAQTPVAHWRFDEGTGTTAKDATTNGLNGTLGTGSSAPTWQTEDLCVSGKCLRFDGTNDYIDVPNTTKFEPGSSGFTFSSWIKNNGSTGVSQYIYWDGTGVASNRPSIQLWMNDTNGQVAGLIRDASGNQVTVSGLGTSIKGDNKWHYVSIILNSTTLSLYLDGILLGTNTNSSLGSINTGSAQSEFIGASGDGGSNSAYFKGFIDDPKIYNYARSTAQIKADFNARGDVKGISTVAGGASPNGGTLSNGLVGYWKMDESSWNSTSGEVLDYSGNAFNGTALPSGSAPTTANGKFGNAGSFDGSNDYVTAPINILGYTEITYAAWIKSSSAPSSNKYNVITGNLGRSGIYIDTNGKANARAFDTNDHYAVGTSTVTDGTWHLLVATYNRQQTKTSIYVDGRLENSISFYPVILTSTTSYIGENPNTSVDVFYSGSMDELRLYNRTLSPAEVSQLYNYAPGPVAYYDFEEGSGSSVNDKSGNGLTGTWAGTGTRHFVDGKVGKAGNFNGIDDKVSVPYSSTFDFPNTSFSIFAWVKTPTLISKDIVSNRTTDSSASKGYSLYTANSGSGLIQGRIADGTNGPSSASSGYSANNWIYAGLVVDRVAGTMTSYNNGVPGVSASISTTGAIDSSNPLTIGKGAKGFLTGAIDEVKVYNYVRTQKQIEEDMLAGGNVLSAQQRINASGIVGYWKFDEGNGTTANNSGNGGSTLNGTLTNMAAPATSTSGWTNSGKFNKGLVFDGTNDYVDTGSINLGTTHSISFWKKTPSTMSAQGHTIIGGAKTPQSYALFENPSTAAASNAMYYQAQGSFVTWLTSSIKNEWQHIVIVRNETSVELFSNGKSLGTQTLNANNSLTINRISSFTDNTYYYNGQLDEIKMYNYALSPSEVKQDYNRGASQVLGSTSTTAAGVNDNSSERAYCPAGDTTASCAPIAEWNFEEGSGTSLKDTSGNNNTATINSGGSFVPGKNGKALRLNGSADVSAADSTSLNIGPNDFTLQGWVKGKNIEAGDCIFCKTNGGGASTTYGFHFSAFSASLYPTLHFATSATSHAQVQGQQTLSNNRWYHVAVVVDRDNTTNTKMYVDGKPVTTTVTNLASHTGSITNTVPLAIGSESDGGFNWDGDLDQLRMYNYARSPAEIAWDYNRGAPVAWWKFDECEGTTVNDSSGNANTGTVTIGGTGTQTAAGTCATSSTAWGNGASGKKNYSLNFDGTDDHVSVADSDSISITGDLTISAWVKVSSYSGFLSILGKTTNGNAAPFDYYMTSGTLTFFRGNGTGYAQVNSSVVPTVGQWQHLVVTMSGTTVRHYLNGKQTATGTLSTTITDNSAPLYIGSRNDFVTKMRGQLDDVRLYNYGLTSTQVKDLYNDGTVNFAPISGTP